MQRNNASSGLAARSVGWFRVNSNRKATVERDEVGRKEEGPEKQSRRSLTKTEDVVARSSVMSDRHGVTTVNIET